MSYLIPMQFYFSGQSKDTISRIQYLLFQYSDAFVVNFSTSLAFFADAGKSRAMLECNILVLIRVII